MFEFLIFSFLLFPFLQYKYLIWSDYTFRTIQSITVRRGALVQVLSGIWFPPRSFVFMAFCLLSRTCLTMLGRPAKSFPLCRRTSRAC